MATFVKHICKDSEQTLISWLEHNTAGGDTGVILKEYDGKYTLLILGSTKDFGKLLNLEISLTEEMFNVGGISELTAAFDKMININS